MQLGLSTTTILCLFQARSSTHWVFGWPRYRKTHPLSNADNKRISSCTCCSRVARRDASRCYTLVVTNCSSVVGRLMSVYYQQISDCCRPVLTYSLTDWRHQQLTNFSSCSGAARTWRWGHRGSGERKSPSGVQGQSPWGVVRGGHSLPKAHSS